jgi:hypothetical protein
VFSATERRQCVISVGWHFGASKTLDFIDSKQAPRRITDMSDERWFDDLSSGFRPHFTAFRPPFVPLFRGPKMITKNRSRMTSRTTNHPTAPREAHRSAHSRRRRVRDLFAGFMLKLPAGDVLAEAAALRASELVCAAEDMRARLVAGDLTDAAADAVVRLENLAHRAELRLAKFVPAPKTYVEEWNEAREAEEAAVEAGLRRPPPIYDDAACCGSSIVSSGFVR